MSDDAILELQSLTKRFGSVTAVCDLNLRVYEGEFIALLGPSGCGKTTTLNILAGFLDPDEGRVLLDGQLLCDQRKSTPPEHRGFAMIFQSYALWPHKTVYENIAYGLKLRGIGSKDAAERVKEILASVQMSNYEKRYPSELSGGQQQRIALARALVVRPRVLLMDEPLSNLDASLREYMRLEIRRLHDEHGITSIYVTHDQTEAMVMSDRIVVMQGGRAEQIDTPRVIFTQPSNEFVGGFIGRMNYIDALLRDGVLHSDSIRQPFDLRRSRSFPGSLPPDGPIRIGFRPHEALIDRSGSDQPDETALMIDAFHLRSVYIGDRLEHVVGAVDGQDLNHTMTLSDRADATPIETGMRVRVQVPLTNVRLFAREDSTTIGASTAQADSA